MAFFKINIEEVDDIIKSNLNKFSNFNKQVDDIYLNIQKVEDGWTEPLEEQFIDLANKDKNRLFDYIDYLKKCNMYVSTFNNNLKLACKNVGYSNVKKIKFDNSRIQEIDSYLVQILDILSDNIERMENCINNYQLMDLSSVEKEKVKLKSVYDAVYNFKKKIDLFNSSIMEILKNTRNEKIRVDKVQFDIAPIKYSNNSKQLFFDDCLEVVDDDKWG